MKISKDENGKLIIDGENETILFPVRGEYGITVEGFGKDAVSQISNMVYEYSEPTGVNKMKMVLNYLFSLERMK